MGNVRSSRFSGADSSTWLKALSPCRRACKSSILRLVQPARQMIHSSFFEFREQSLAFGG